VSDFFANVAARAVEGSAAIRPRLATRFEPAARPEPFTEVVVETTAAGPTAPTPIVPVAEEALTATPSLTESALTGSVAVPPAPQAMGGIPVASVPPAEPPPGRSAMPESPPHDDEDKSATVATPIVAAPAARPEPAAGDVTPTPQLSAAPRGDRAAAQPIVEKTHRAPPLAAPAFPRTLPTSLRRETGTTPAPRVAVVEQPVPPPVETIVHVSIGRIELRAPPTPAATKRERVAPAVTTLSEYLQQRGARSRT
jgi:hypothetical protein